MSQRILAIDTATGPCSVAVWADGKVAAFLEHKGPAMQSARLFPMIEEILKKSRLKYPDLTAVVATIGPGSFTGIRTGLAAARGIGFAAGIPSFGFTSLEVLAFGAKEHLTSPLQPILAILNAGKGEWYYQGFKKPRTPMFAPRLDRLEAATQTAGASTLIAGNASVEGHTKSTVTAPRADILAALAAAHASEGQPLKPYYIRPPDAKPQAKII